MCNENQLKRILDEVSIKVQALLGSRLHNIILFGSYARGDYNDESDIDIMVLADINSNELPKLRDSLADISSDSCLENGIVVSILVKDKTLFEQRLPILPFYQNVINDGVQVYAQ